MQVDCEGCAGCCIDWRPLSDRPRDHERRGPHQPIDDVYNLAPLSHDEVRAFVDAGYGDALTPRLWESEEGVEIGGRRLAAIDGKPTFFVGLRKPPKPVGPFGVEPRWLSTCVFLDPTTLQCRIHDDDLYPTECAEYPGHNLALGTETECERVEAEFGKRRLLDDDPPDDVDGLLLGPQAVGAKVFVHPEPETLSGTIDRVAERMLTREDRAEFVATAAAAAPGTTGRNEARYEAARERILEADSWAGRAIQDWIELANQAGTPAPSPEKAIDLEEDRGAPGTPGWED
ncbi:MAG: hypothetical protein ACI91T_002752 [Natronomonas sp.]|jgi:hypothetical protein